MDTTFSATKKLNGIELSLNGPPTVVILKAEFDEYVDYHIERFEYAQDKVIPYPSDLFKLGFIKSTVLELHKDSGTAGPSDRVCKECQANGVYSCEHIPVGDYVLGKKAEKEEKKNQKPSKDMDDLGYGSAEMCQG